MRSPSDVVGGVDAPNEGTPKRAETTYRRRVKMHGIAKILVINILFLVFINVKDF